MGIISIIPVVYIVLLLFFKWMKDLADHWRSSTLYPRETPPQHGKQAVPGSEYSGYILSGLLETHIFSRLGFDTNASVARPCFPGCNASATSE